MFIPYLISLLIAQEGLEWGFLGLGLLCLLIPLVWFIIGILLAIWVYRDAESRGMNGVMWLIILFIAGIVGLIIYLIVRKDKTQNKAPPPPP
jgi:heme/copper-type cytochrome/quinol oxidase subunit 2